MNCKCFGNSLLQRTRHIAFAQGHTRSDPLPLALTVKGIGQSLDLEQSGAQCVPGECMCDRRDLFENTLYVPLLFFALKN